VNGWLASSQILYFEVGTLIAATIVLIVILKKK